MSDIPDPVTQDQLDLYHRITSCDWFADVPVLLEEKGVTESDINQKLSTLNKKSGKAGVVAVVLMVELEPQPSNDIVARWRSLPTVQVIEAPLLNRGANGIGKTGAQVATRIRQEVHLFSNGYGGTLEFAGQTPLPADPGKTSYGVQFSRVGMDARYDSVATPTAAVTAETAPATVTLSCATAGATILYTLDGSYPGPANEAALVYADPLELAVAAEIRVAAYAAGKRASNVRLVRIA